MRDSCKSQYSDISGLQRLASPFYVSFVIVNRRDGITPRFVRHRYVYVYIHAVARPSSLCLINSLREVRGCATVGCSRGQGGRGGAGYERRATRSSAERVAMQCSGVEDEAVELFGVHEVPARSDVLIQCCLDALIK